MKNELSIRNNNQLSNSLMQSANKIYNIEKAGTVNNINIFSQKEVIDDGFIEKTEYDFEFYNLLVLDTKISSRIIKIDKALVFPANCTEYSIRNMYFKLSNENLKKLISYPLLILPTTNLNYGHYEENKFAYYGFIDNISILDENIELSCKFDSNIRITATTIRKIASSLGILNTDLLITELHKPHWTLKKINLKKVLHEKNIKFY